MSGTNKNSSNPHAVITAATSDFGFEFEIFFDRDAPISGRVCRRYPDGYLRGDLGEGHLGDGI
jgi:hypothetical protein